MDTVYNDRLEDWLAIVEPCLPHLDVFAPSYEEAVRITGLEDHHEIARFLLDRGSPAVVIKLGDRGSYYSDGAAEAELPCFDVDAVDTTGAGDCFMAGYLLAMLDDAPPEERLRWGNAVAAHCVQAVGANAGVGTREAVARWMETAKLKS